MATQNEEFWAKFKDAFRQIPRLQISDEHVLAHLIAYYCSEMNLPPAIRRGLDLEFLTRLPSPVTYMSQWEAVMALIVEFHFNPFVITQLTLFVHSLTPGVETPQLHPSTRNLPR